MKKFLALSALALMVSGAAMAAPVSGNPSNSGGISNSANVSLTIEKWALVNLTTTQQATLNGGDTSTAGANSQKGHINADLQANCPITAKITHSDTGSDITWNPVWGTNNTDTLNFATAPVDSTQGIDVNASITGGGFFNADATATHSTTVTVTVTNP